MEATSEEGHLSTQDNRACPNVYSTRQCSAHQCTIEAFEELHKQNVALHSNLD